MIALNIPHRVLFLIVVLIGVGTLCFNATCYASGSLEPLREFTSKDLARDDAHLRESIHYPKHRFPLEDRVKPVDMLWDAFSELSLERKCHNFFRALDKDWPSWKFPLLRKRDHDKLIEQKQKYFERAVCILKMKAGKIDKEENCKFKLEGISSKSRAQFNEEFNKNAISSIKLENEIADIITVFRVFGHCFYGDELDLRQAPTLKDMYARYSKKLIPHLKQHVATPLDIISNAGSDYYNSKELGKNDNMMSFFHDKTSGTGIVISCATHHLKDMVRLIHTLRLLNNELPIQVIYRNDLLALSINAIQYAATVSKKQLLGSVFSDTQLLESLLKDIDMKILDLEKLPLPPQKITLINILNTLSQLGKTDLSHYRSKIAALFYTSYENVLLLDADSVPLIKPQEFFDFPDYKKNGAYFFRDRSLMYPNDWQETNFFATMMPHKSSLLDMAMGIKPVTEKTMDNQFMRGWRHMQEAGVVAFNRKRHFKSLLTLMALSLWREPIESSIWGDKELYWLAMSAAGDEDYVVHPIDAAAVGEYTENPAHKRYTLNEVKELCSTHPGHVTAEGKLLWINSGFSFCKNNPYYPDLEKFPFSVFQTEKEVEDVFESPLRLRHALVPPPLPKLRAGTPAKDREEVMLKYFKESAKDFDDLKVDQVHDQLPFKTWFMVPICAGHMQCAYSKSLMKLEGHNSEGKSYDFLPEDTKFFDMVGAVWLSAKRVAQLPDGFELEPTDGYSSTDQVPDVKKLHIDSLPLALDTVKYDPSNARERPEKVNMDLKLLIEELFKGKGEIKKENQKD